MSACGIFLRNSLAAKATDHHKVKDLCKNLMGKNSQYKVYLYVCVCTCVCTCVCACVCVHAHTCVCDMCEHVYTCIVILILVYICC